MSFALTIVDYLIACKIKISKRFVLERIQSHPHYPTLLAVTETFEELGLQHSAMAVDKNHLRSLDYPILAHCTENSKSYFRHIDNYSAIEKNIGAFMETWDGIVLSVVNKCLVNNEKHNLQYKQERSTRIFQYAFVIISIAVLLGPIINSFQPSLLIFAILNIVGIIVCYNIMLYVLGAKNTVAKKFCASSGIFNCDIVLKSKAGKLLKTVGLGDVGLIYFCSCSIYLFVYSVSSSVSASLSVLIILSLGACVGTLISLWYQWKILKSWCKMCLIVVGIIWSQAISFLSRWPEKMLLLPPLFSLSLFLLIVVVAVLTWLTLKPLIAARINSYSTNLTLKKMRRDPAIFLARLYEQRELNVEPWEYDIILGNPHASIVILTVCNPYCVPCAESHKIMEELMKRNMNEVKIIIRFLVPSPQNENKWTVAAKNILNAYWNYRTGLTTNPVDIWFSNMSLDAFSTIFPPISSDDKTFNEILQKYHVWSDANNITYTPTILINGFEIPPEYQLIDLLSLTAHLNEKLESKSQVAMALS